MRRITTTVSGRPMVAWNLPGRKPSVVCVHGAGSSGPSCGSSDLATTRGPSTFLGSEPAAGLRPTGHALAETLAECLTILDLERVVLRGGSFS